MRGQQGVTHRHRNEVGLCQAGSLKLHQDAALFLYTFSVGLLMVCQVRCVILIGTCL